MKINKYNKKNQFILEQMNNKVSEYDTLDISDEMKSYKFKEFKNSLISIDEETKIVNPINSNLMDKNVVENIFNNTNDTLKIIDSKLEELDFLNNNIRTNFDFIINPLYLKINNILANSVENITSTTIVENFEKNKFYDNSCCTIKNGFLELVYDEYANENFTGTVEVLESNGLPGDTHRGYIQGGEVFFNGEEALNIDLTNIFSLNECLSYELITVQPKEYKSSKGYGFKYDEGISFISNEKTLNLTLKITFSKVKNMNIIKFNDTQVSNYIIKKLKIIDENGVSTTIADNKNSNTFNIFNFKECKVSSIILELQQPNKDKTYIGHFYKSVLKESTAGYKADYEEIKIGSILNLGVTINNNNQITHGKTSIAKSISLKKENLFKSNLYNNDYARELVLAERASITINAFNCYIKKYKDSGNCTFKYSYKNAINGVTLDATEFSPEGTSIKYQISFDNINWHSIVPNYRVGDTDIHTVNLNSIVTSSNLNSKTIFTDKKVYDVFLKVNLSTSNKNLSAIVSSIALKIRE